MRITELAHEIVYRSLKPGDRTVDATVGNGHDTAFLADCVGKQGRVFGFDVQAEALGAAAERVGGLPQVTLIHAGHETMTEHLPGEARGRIAAVMFNLGYLPGGDKAVITREATTLVALDQALRLIAPGGVITLVLYPGHPGGAEETQAVCHRAQSLSSPFEVTRHVRLNAETAPELIVIERTR